MLQTNWNVSISPVVYAVSLMVSHFSPSFPALSVTSSFSHSLCSLILPFSSTHICLLFSFRRSTFFFATFVRFFFSLFFFLNKKTIFKFYATPNTYYFLISLRQWWNSPFISLFLLLHGRRARQCIESHTNLWALWSIQWLCVNNGFNAKMLSLCLVKSSKDDSSHYDSEKNHRHTHSQTYRSNARPANAISLESCAQQQAIFGVTKSKCYR